ncbi:hypothetical protein VTK73DRAFT_6247 [Phialemonium thermophilum]|uniref:Uncharacterized protein n=1 Tax=Phialemonium thermophilum TaxID=223376 RepID=A0ABR3V1I0_9PEZI
MPAEVLLAAAATATVTRRVHLSGKQAVGVGPRGLGPMLYSSSGWFGALSLPFAMDSLFVRRWRVVPCQLRMSLGICAVESVDSFLPVTVIRVTTYKPKGLAAWTNRLVTWASTVPLRHCSCTCMALSFSGARAGDEYSAVSVEGRTHWSPGQYSLEFRAAFTGVQDKCSSVQCSCLHILKTPPFDYAI